MPEAYTSTVVAPTQITLAVIIGAVTAIVLEAIDTGLWPYAIAAVVVILATGIYLATVSLTVAGDRVTIGQGRGERSPRSIHISEIAEQYTADLTWPQCFGVGMPTAMRMTRLTVRAGPTLCLTLNDGELIRISTPHPETALALLGGVRKDAS